MKKIILSTLLIAVFSLAGWSQSEVYLMINHKLGASPFTINHTASNNLGDNFNVERLDFYISEITLIHDGGQRTPVTDHYIMVDVIEFTSDYLGSFNITNLEAVEFGIGVDPGKNHSDITQYPPNHALSFQLPSMHWGWSAGYRFIAMEGKTGASMNLTWELHALGDANYGYATVNTTGTQIGNKLYIALSGDYELAMKDIPVSGSLNYHGEGLYAVDIMDNFKNLVFTEGTANIGMAEQKLLEVEMAPNPTTGDVTIFMPQVAKGQIVRVTDMTGKLILERSFDFQGTLNLHIEDSGAYIVQVVSGDQLIGRSKLIVQ